MDVYDGQFEYPIFPLAFLFKFDLPGCFRSQQLFKVQCKTNRTDGSKIKTHVVINHCLSVNSFHGAEQ